MIICECVGGGVKIKREYEFARLDWLLVSYR